MKRVRSSKSAILALNSSGDPGVQTPASNSKINLEEALSKISLRTKRIYENVI